MFNKTQQPACCVAIQKRTCMSHVKNVDAFAKLVNFCTGYGGAYTPGNPNLQLDSLHAKLQEAREVMNRLMIVKSHFDTEVNHRKQAYDQLPKLTASILLTLAASGTHPETLKDARFFVHQMNGYRANNRQPIPSESGEVKVHHSMQQLAYVSQADSFRSLIQTVNLEPLYMARESHLHKEGLFTTAENLNQFNARVLRARVDWSNAIIERNKMLYTGSASLYVITKRVKKYVRAIFGLNSEQYKQIKKICIHYP